MKWPHGIDGQKGRKAEEQKENNCHIVYRRIIKTVRPLKDQDFHLTLVYLSVIKY